MVAIACLAQPSLVYDDFMFPSMEGSMAAAPVRSQHKNRHYQLTNPGVGILYAGLRKG